MDIFKIGRVPTISSTSNSKRNTTKDSSDRDAQQGGDGYRKEEPASESEAKKACDKLKLSPHFVTNGLNVEVREEEGRYFLDVFDPQHRKVKTIGAVGIRAILTSYNYESSQRSGILDRKI